MLPVVKGGCEERFFYYFFYFSVKGYGKSQLSGIEKQHLTAAARAENKQHKNSPTSTPAMHITRFPPCKEPEKGQASSSV